MLIVFRVTSCVLLTELVVIRVHLHTNAMVASFPPTKCDKRIRDGELSDSAIVDFVALWTQNEEKLLTPFERRAIVHGCISGQRVFEEDSCVIDSRLVLASIHSLH